MYIKAHAHTHTHTHQHNLCRSNTQIRARTRRNKASNKPVSTLFIMKITESKQRRLRHYIDAPKRFLRRARDLYVDSLVSIDSKVGSANIITCPAPNASHMPKNYSSNTMKDDEERLEEMYRSICSKYNGNSVESDRGGCLRDRGSGYGAIDRSYSIALGKIGTIDEDEPCEFQETLAVKNDLFLRSRSHAVTSNYSFH